MKKNIVKLNENTLKQIVAESVKKVLKEMDEFTPNGYRGLNNYGGNEIQISKNGDSARLKFQDGEITDWLEIEFDEEGVAWNFQYIYYNDIFFGKPREKGHNEFRLTCVREYIKKYNIKSGNQIWFSIDDNGVRHIGYIDEIKESNINENGVRVIKLSPGWHCIEY